MIKPLSITMKLDELICYDEGDGWGKAEPYLWTVFFKVDGDTVELTEALQLSGTGTVHTTPGSHGNLDVDSVDAGDTVAIPSDIGEWKTILKPIPVPETLSTLIDPIGGIIGCVCILMEEDNVSDSGAEAGHNALNASVQSAINQIISNISISNPEVSEEDLEAFEDDIKTAIKNAIQNEQNVFENLWSWLNEDDTIGTKVFFFEHDDLEIDTIHNYSVRWRNEGDWEIKGSMTVGPTCTIDFANILSAKSAKSFEIDSLRDFRNLSFRKHPLLKEWGNILIKNNPYLIDVIIRDERLKKSAINLANSATDFVTGKVNTIPESSYKDALSIIEALEKTGDKRAILDAKKLRKVMPLLENKNLEEATLFLASNAPNSKLRDIQ